MKFKFCSVGDKIYGESLNVSGVFTHSLTMMNKEPKQDFNIQEIQKDFWAINSAELNTPLPGIKTQKDIIEYFLKCTALCHECLIEENGEETVYIGQSPDEITLVSSAMKIGVKCAKNTAGLIELEINLGHEKIKQFYEKISLFEFNSDRKRNSVVVREMSTNTYFLFIKGADNIIYGLLDKTHSEYLDKVSRDLLAFSEKGLRTLVLGYKIIEEPEFNTFKAMYDEASCSVDSREEKIKKVAEMIECKINILGCTAVEDSLQEEVPETIQDLLNAGINI